MRANPVFLMLSLLLVSALACGDDEPETRVPARDQSEDADAQPDASPDLPAPPEDTSPDLPPVATALPPGGITRSWQVGASVQGRPLIAELYGSRGPAMLVLSAIHGDERSAVTLGEQSRADLLGGMAAEAGVQVVYVGAANPDGIQADTRFNARQIDLNRNFDAASFFMGMHSGGSVPASEPETIALTALIDQLLPEAVISVHCCIPTMDYDGPGLSLAEAMSDAANTTLAARLPSGSYAPFPPEKLGASPGSMGSYVGVDRQVPIITVEFSAGHRTPILPQLEAVRDSLRAALRWGAAQAPSSPLDLNAELQALAVSDADAVGYSSADYPSSSAQHTLRVERREGVDRDAPGVLILAGVRDNAPRALHIAEHIRRVVLHDATPAASVTLLTSANPTGVADQRATLNGKPLEDALASAPIATPEAALLDALVREQRPRLIVLVEDDVDASAPTLQGAMQDLQRTGAAAAAARRLTVRRTPLTGPLAQLASSLDIAILRLGVDRDYGEGDLRGTTVRFDKQDVFSALVLSLIE